MSPKEACETLLNALLPAAEDLLRQHGEFYPIGAVLSPEDAVTLTAVSYGDDEYPESRRMIDDLTDAHRKQAAQQEISASGIAWNAVIAGPDGQRTNAVLLSLEHAGGYSALVAAPYAIGPENEVSFGELLAQRGLHNVFPDAE